MQINYKKFLNIIVPISLGVFFIYYSFIDIDISKFADHIYKANYLWVFVGIIFGALSHISRSYRWKYLFEPMGYKLSFKNSLLSVFAGYLINFSLPRAGDIARGSIISKYEDIPFDKTMGTIVAERLIDLLCISIIILFGTLAPPMKNRCAVLTKTPSLSANPRSNPARHVRGRRRS